MTKISIILAGIMILSACKPSAPEIQKDELIGVWECLSGCEFEQYDFYKSDEGYGFYIYSGQRMYRSGSWHLEKNRITLSYDDEETVSYPVSLKNDTLVFGKDEMIFTPFIPYNSEDEEEADQENPVEDLLSMDFTDPEPAEFIWHVPVDESSVEEFSVEGMMVQTSVELKGDFTPIGETTGVIAGHLKMLGYMSSEYNISEIVNGYIRDDYRVKYYDVVLIKPVINIEDTVGEVTIQVLYGKLMR